MLYRKTAKIISLILGPLWLPVLLVAGIFKTDLSTDQIKILFPLLSVLLVVLPLGYLIIGPRLGWIKHWEMKSKKERVPFLILVFATSLISIVLILIFGNILLLKLTVVLFILLVMILGISRYWKVSIHTSLNTTGAIFLNFLFNWKLPYLYLTIPLIYWSRFYLKRHNNKQLLAGILLSAAVTIIGILFITKF